MSGIVGTSHSKSKVVGRSLDTAKAYGLCNGSGVLQNSYNVSSVTHPGGGGDFKFNFITTLGSQGYSAVSDCTANWKSAINDWNNLYVQVLIRDESNAYDEPTYVSFIAF